MLEGFPATKSIELYYELQHGAFSLRNRLNISQTLWHQSHSDTSHSDTTSASINSPSRLLLYQRILCLTCYELSVLKEGETLSLYHDFSKIRHGVLTRGIQYGWLIARELYLSGWSWSGQGIILSMKAIWWFEMRSKNLQWHVHMFCLYLYTSYLFPSEMQAKNLQWHVHMFCLYLYTSRYLYPSNGTKHYGTTLATCAVPTLQH